MHRELIDEFGGTKRLAAALGVPMDTARKWRSRGIPANYWRRVERLSRRRISFARLAAAAAARH